MLSLLSSCLGGKPESPSLPFRGYPFDEERAKVLICLVRAYWVTSGFPAFDA